MYLNNTFRILNYLIQRIEHMLHIVCPFKFLSKFSNPGEPVNYVHICPVYQTKTNGSVASTQNFTYDASLFQKITSQIFTVNKHDFVNGME